MANVSRRGGAIPERIATVGDFVAVADSCGLEVALERSSRPDERIDMLLIGAMIQAHDPELSGK